MQLWLAVTLVYQWRNTAWHKEMHGRRCSKLKFANSGELISTARLKLISESSWTSSDFRVLLNFISSFFLSFLLVTLTALILSRDALLIGYAFYLRYKSLPSPVGFTSLNLFIISQQTNAGNAVFKCVHLSYFLVKTTLCWFL